MVEQKQLNRIEIAIEIAFQASILRGNRPSLPHLVTVSSLLKAMGYLRYTFYAEGLGSSSGTVSGRP